MKDNPVTPELTIERNDDGTVSAAYLRIRKGDFARTQEVIPGTVMLDYDENDRIVGIELLEMIEVEKAAVARGRRSWECPKCGFDNSIPRDVEQFPVPGQRIVCDCCKVGFTAQRVDDATPA